MSQRITGYFPPGLPEGGFSGGLHAFCYWHKDRKENKHYVVNLICPTVETHTRHYCVMDDYGNLVRVSK